MNSNYVNLNLGGGKLYQFAGRTGIQMMSYLLEAADGRLIMIDGGNYCDGDADFLYDLLMSKGGRVSAWFITHAHDDHFGALSKMLEREDFSLRIDGLYYDFPDMEWISKCENGINYDFVSTFLGNVARKGLNVIKPKGGQSYDFGIRIEVLNSLGDYSRYVNVNDTTITLKAHYPKRDVLFLGDLASGAQEKVMSAAGEKLRCDIVQMAHHGQCGVSRDMYEYIKPRICLWTSPDWLWNNDKGEGFDTGPWLTVRTREWMEECGVQANFPAAYGDYIFD